MGPEVWKSGETCVWRGVYGTISILFQGAALVEFDGYDRLTIPLDQLTRPPHAAAHRPTGRWDSGNRLAPTNRKAGKGAGRTNQGEEQPKDGHDRRRN